MIYGNKPEDYRIYFFKAWEKYKNKELLDPIESQIVALLLAHPEYHKIFDSSHIYLTKEYFSEDEQNPFLHLSLHLALRDQINLDQPKGISQLYQKALHQFNSHEVEHKIMAILADELWLMQKKQQHFNTENYLEKIKEQLDLVSE